MAKKVLLVVPEAPSPASTALVDELQYPVGGLDLESVRGRVEVAAVRQADTGIRALDQG